MSWPEYRVSQYGFVYGSASVERVFSDERYGIVIRVASASNPRKFVDVRVSRAGRVVGVVS